MNLLENITGLIVPQNYLKGSLLCVKELANYMSNINNLNLITDETEETVVQQRVRLYLLWLCGWCFFH